jgi:hypothetical protein
MKLFSEKMSPLGVVNIDSITNLFAVTELDDVSVFVRETAQNSWDARDKSTASLGKGIDLDYRVRSITVALQASLDKVFFKDATGEIKNKLNRHTREGQTYLIVQDKGTIGLAGPTLATEQGTKNNYVAFLLNIGQDHPDATTGGSFGFGKTVFFKASAPKTILVYTRTKNAQEVLESRFIGVTLHKTPGDKEHTGRHWWCEPGKSNGIDIPRPIIGKEADKLAELIGIKPYEASETGTSITVFGPEFENLKREGTNNPDPQTLADCLAEAANFWYWPRMEGGGSNDGKLRCKVWHQDALVSPFDYAQTSPFSAYKKCLEAIQRAVSQGSSGITNSQFQQFHEIKYFQSRVGYLCLMKFPKCERQLFKSRIINHATGLPVSHPLNSFLWRSGPEDPCSRHVALLRAPGQVIQYLRLSECNDNMLEYVGVFFLHPEGSNGGAFNKEFTKAEPAAHDKWEFNSSGVVAKTVDKIKDLVREFARPEAAGATSSASGMGSISTSLASLWSSGEGAGGTIIRPITPTGKDGKKSKIVVKPGKLFAIEGVNYVSIQFHALDLEGWSRTVKYTLKSVLYGGGNDDINNNEDGNPRFIGWFGEEPSAGTTAEIEAGALSTEATFEIPESSSDGERFHALFLAPSTYWAEFNIVTSNG